MQDNNIEESFGEYLQSLNAQREEEKNQADAQREADINSLTNIFTKEGTTNG